MSNIYIRHTQANIYIHLTMPSLTLHIFSYNDNVGFENLTLITTKNPEQTTWKSVPR